MFRNKRIISSMISLIFTAQIVTSTVLSPLGVHKVEAANQSDKEVTTITNDIPQTGSEELLPTETYITNKNESKEVEETVNEPQNNQSDTEDEITESVDAESDEETELNNEQLGIDGLNNDVQVNDILPSPYMYEVEPIDTTSTEAIFSDTNVLYSDDLYITYDNVDGEVNTVNLLNTSILLGDVNDNGSVDSIDFALMRMYLLGKRKSLPNEAAGDLDANGSVNSLDFAYMRKLLLGKIKPEDLPAAKVTPTPTSTEVVTPTPSPSETVIETPTPTSTPNEDAEKPTSPQNLEAVVTDLKITLSWDESTDNVGVAGYNVYRDNELIGTTDGTTFVDDNNGEGLSAGEEYEYSVEAFDEAGNYSDRVTIKVATLLNDITNISVIQNKLNEDDTVSITISWNRVNNAKKYIVCADGIFTFEVPKEYTSFTHENLIKNTKHSYKVQVVYSNGSKSAWSDTIRVISAPQKPIEVNAEIDSSDLTTVKIIWNSVVGAGKYQILLDGSTYATIKALPTNETLYYVNGLTTNKDYICEIRALDSNGKDMGNSGRVLVNTGESTLTKNTVFYENRVYRNLIIKMGTKTLDLNGYILTVEGDCNLERPAN